MTNRTSLTVVAIAGVSAIGAIGCATSSSAGGAVPTPAQYAAIADDACAGIAAKERELGVLAYRDAIVSVAPFKEASYVGKAKVTHTEGSVIVLRATQGLSVPWIERVNSCHVALAGAGRLPGNDAVADPFVIPGATVSATEVYAGFALIVRGANQDSASEIAQRSYAILSAPTRPPTASLVSP